MVIDMKKNIFINALVCVFITSVLIDFSNLAYMKNPQNKPLRVSPYVTEVNLKCE